MISQHKVEIRGGKREDEEGELDFNLTRIRKMIVQIGKPIAMVKQAKYLKIKMR